MLRFQNALASASLLVLATLAAACDATSTAAPRSRVGAALPTHGVLKNLIDGQCSSWNCNNTVNPGDTLALQIGASYTVNLNISAPAADIRVQATAPSGTGISLSGSQNGQTIWTVSAGGSACLCATTVTVTYWLQIPGEPQVQTQYQFVVLTVAPPPTFTTTTFFATFAQTSDDISVSRFASGFRGAPVTLVSATPVNPLPPGASVGVSSDQGAVHVTPPFLTLVPLVPVEIQVTVTDGHSQATGIITVVFMY